MSRCVQVSRKAPRDDEFLEAVSGRRHFWLQWLHGSRRNKAQDRAAAAAAAREAAQSSAQNRFDVLAAGQVYSIALSDKAMLIGGILALGYTRDGTEDVAHLLPATAMDLNANHPSKSPSISNAQTSIHRAVSLRPFSTSQSDSVKTQADMLTHACFRHTRQLKTVTLQSMTMPY